MVTRRKRETSEMSERVEGERKMCCGLRISSSCYSRAAIFVRDQEQQALVLSIQCFLSTNLPEMFGCLNRPLMIEEHYLGAVCLLSCICKQN